MNTYYEHEDETESPETQLDNFRAQMGAALAVNEYAEGSIAELRSQAEVLWNKAAERGDVETQNGVVEMYNVASHLKDNVIYTNEAMKGVLAAAEALAKQKKQSEASYDELVEAIYDVDTDHPIVSGLVETVEQNAYEFASDGLYDDAWESAAESIYSDFYTTLRKLAPTASYFTMERLVSALKGDDELNDIQRGLLLSFLQTFMTEIKAS